VIPSELSYNNIAFNNILGGANHTIGINTTMSPAIIYVWGNNNLVTTLPKAIDTGLVLSQIGTGANHCLGIDTNGLVVAWGDNSYGQINIPQSIVSPSQSTLNNPLPLQPGKSGYSGLSAKAKTTIYTLVFILISFIICGLLIKFYII
jgi:alpha-tubulin suppressor-like RCC1 family protein